MAFVFEEERNLNFNKDSDINELGPGQYLLISDNKPIKENKFPFQSGTKKFSNSLNLNPGPGEYYHDEFEEKNKKIRENAKEMIIKKEEFERKNLPENKKKLVRENYERFGFNSKEKRFKKDIHDDRIGPGNYFKDNDNIKKDEKKNVIKNSDIKNYNKNKEKIASIPNKFFFGYEEDVNGKLSEKPNPNFYKQFSGLKGDTVGPGTYDIDFPEKWRIKGTNFSKSKVPRFSKKKIRPKTSTNINHINCESGNFRGKFIKNQMKENNNNNFNKLNYKNYVIKQSMKNQPIINKNNNYRSFFIVNNNPGPGYYYDVDNNSSFNKIKNKNIYTNNKNYFFGSSCNRFGQGATTGFEEDFKSNLGPGSYFIKKYSNTFQKNHIKNFLNNNNNDRNIAFLSKQDRFGSNLIKNNSNNDISSMVQNKNAMNKSFDSTTNNTSKSTLMGTFYRKERRFFESESDLKKQMENPGPGSYINPFSNTGDSNTIQFNGRFVDIRTGKNLLNSNEINSRPKTSSINNNINKNISGKEKFYNSNLYTIEYKNNKLKHNCNMYSFNSSELSKRNLIENKNNVGPGSYFNNEYAFNKNNNINGSYNETGFSFNKHFYKNGFNSTNERFKVSKNNCLGPGEYSLNESYPWVKKSFNIKYL
jgi:hypothetical protein